MVRTCGKGMERGVLMDGDGDVCGRGTPHNHVYMNRMSPYALLETITT